MKKIFFSSIILLWLLIPCFGELQQESRLEIKVTKVITLLMSGNLGNAQQRVKFLKSSLSTEHDKKIGNALQLATECYSLIDSFYNLDEKEQWVFELFSKRIDQPGAEKDFVDVNEVILLHPKKEISSVYDFVNNRNKTISPVEIATKIQQKSDLALAELSNMKGYSVNQIRALLYLEKVYGYKIVGAVELEMYNQLDEMIKEHQRYSVEALTKAGIYWRMYSRIVENESENSIWLRNISLEEFQSIYRRVLDDIILAKSSI